MNDQDVYIYDAIRTPRGLGKAAKGDKPGGSLAEIPPQKLIAELVEALRERAPNYESNLDSFALGCVGQVYAQGGHLGLVSRQTAQLPSSVAVQTVNNNCISSLTALNNSAAKARDGHDALHLAGGVECLSQVGFLADQAPYYSDPVLAEQIAWTPPVMGAELIATLNDISKEQLDELTLVSHQRAAEAWSSGFYDSFVVHVKDSSGNTLLKRDELIRPTLTKESLCEMPPAFIEQGASGFDAMMLKHYPELSEINHVHSFAHCPGLADGASLSLVGTRQAGEKTGLVPKVRIKTIVETAGNPVTQLEAGMLAMDMALERSGHQVDDFDCIEFMEAFAAVPAKFVRDYQPDSQRVNINGGHLAMGHPMGATGTILIAQCLHQLVQSGGELGLVVGTAGGGLGAALVLENVS